MLTITAESHLDHNLTPAHVAWLLERYKKYDAFFIATVTLPDDLEPIPCALYGPSTNDPPVLEADVIYAVRGNRKCASRMVRFPTRLTWVLTVIAGPSGDQPCVLYTSYGGPLAPREPGDPGIASWADLEAARAFWAEHALASVPV